MWVIHSYAFSLWDHIQSFYYLVKFRVDNRINVRTDEMQWSSRIWEQQDLESDEIWSEKLRCLSIPKQTSRAEWVIVIAELCILESCRLMRNSVLEELRVRAYLQSSRRKSVAEHPGGGWYLSQLRGWNEKKSSLKVTHISPAHGAHVISFATTG